MKRRRALLLSIAVVLTLCAACGVWLHRERQQYTLNRRLIAVLERNDTKTALALVNAGANPNTRYFSTPAPSLSQLLKHLLHHTPPPANDSPPALMLACYKNVKTGVGKSETPVSEEAKLSLLHAMLSHGANVNARTGGIGTALNYAAFAQHPRIVELLLLHGADANIPDNKGRTPLRWAVSSEKTQEARLLLAHGANPNVQDTDGNTALNDVLFSSNAKDLIPVLLAHGANPNLPNKQGLTPLQLAQQEGRSDLVRLLKQHGGK